MHKILVVSNCLSLGYTKSIKLLRPNDDVEFATMGQTLTGSGFDFAPYDVIFTSVEHKQNLERKDPNVFDGKKVCLLPTILFFGFHPDTCYMRYEGNLLKLMGQDYHSTLSWFGFELGLSVDETMALYHPNLLKKFGIGDIYQIEKQALIQNFRTHGLNLDKRFAKWSRTGSFMYSVNHPRIDVVFDIARESLRVNGLAPVEHVADDAFPAIADNLANGPVLPLLPPIAEALGLNAGTNYKMANDRVLSQREFIAESHALYASLDADKISYHAYRFSLEKLKSFITLPERSLAT